MRILSILLLILPAAALAQIPTISAGATNVQEGQSVTMTCTANCTSLTWQVNGITGGNSTVGTISGSGSTATYTAPASIKAQQQMLGCQIYPNDAVWNVPVNTLPYLSNFHGNSSLNDSYFIGWLAGKGFGNLSFDSDTGVSKATSATPTVPINVTFANYKDNIRWPGPMDFQREGGKFDTNWNNDHHSSIVSTDDCQYTEMYNDEAEKVHCNGDPVGTTNCWFVDSDVSPEFPYKTYSWTGGVDAANEPVMPLVPRLDEIKSGAVNHALRFDLVRGYAPGSSNGVADTVWPSTGATGFCSPGVLSVTVTSGGSGYSPSTTATITGDPSGSGATLSLTIVSGVITGVTVTNQGTAYQYSPLVATVTLANTGGGTGAVLTPVIDWPCPPYGARYVLDPAYFAAHNGPGCSAGTKCLTGAAQIIGQTLATYGMFMNDNTCCGIFSAYLDRDITGDRTIFGQLISGTSGINTLTISDFHIVDESGLAQNSLVNRNTGCGGGPCQNAQVVPNNTAGITPSGSIWITATNSSGASNAANIIGVAPTIGTPDTEIAVLAGSYTWQIPFWVNNAPATAVTWTCSTCSGNGSSITSSGLYSPPTALTASGTQDIAVATLNSDSNITTTVYIKLIPNSGNFVANTVRMDVGNTSADIGPDGNGHYWAKDVGGIYGNAPALNAPWQYYVGQELNEVKTGYYSTADVHYKFIVPNGEYAVRVVSGWDTVTGGSSPSISTHYWNHSPIEVEGEDAGVENIKIVNWNVMAHAAFPYAQNSNAENTFYSNVTDNTLVVELNTGAIYAGSANKWPGCDGVYGAGFNNNCVDTPELQLIDIEPITNPHTWQIGVTNGIPPANAPSYPVDTPFLSAGSNISLYIQDIGTGLNDPAWSIVSGPGTLTAQTFQFNPQYSMNFEKYTAPVTQPYSNRGVVIKAQSQSNPSVSATITLFITGTATTASFFK